MMESEAGDADFVDSFLSFKRRVGRSELWLLLCGQRPQAAKAGPACNLIDVPVFLVGMPRDLPRTDDMPSLHSIPRPHDLHPTSGVFVSKRRASFPTIPREEVVLGERLGSGASGDVFAGTYRGEDVAVKVGKNKKKKGERRKGIVPM